MTMAESFDVVVVGARCAGSPLGAMLARAGLRVAVVEQARFPRDTLSTHCLQAGALASLDRLGVTDQVRATGAPYLRYFDLRQDEFEARVEIPQRPGDVGGIASVRRLLLDPILAEAAERAGAHVRMETRVTGLLEDRGRVAGVRVTRNRSERTLAARLVVGADGRNSTIARLVRARRYNVVPNERFAYWTFFEGAQWSRESFVFHRWSDRLVFGGYADSGLFQVIVVPQLSELPGFREDLEGSFIEHARSCQPMDSALVGARRVEKFFGLLRWEGFFREVCGPGWVLVGDAGHFKDPTPAAGIQDALRQAETLAPVIAAGIGEDPPQLDKAVSQWGRWRDRDAAEHYWLACDMGAAGATPAVLPELMRRLLEDGRIGQFLDLLTHRSKPSQVLTPPRVLGATGRLLARTGTDRRALMRELGSLIINDARRRRRNERPAYDPPDAKTDAEPADSQLTKFDGKEEPWSLASPASKGSTSRSQKGRSNRRSRSSLR
jgi:flavin-dependent dehydrogenase